MIQAMELGRFRLYPLCDGYFRLDGGSMFGIVPKAMWSRQCPADEKNRISLAIRSLLIEAGNQWILVDTGLGDKFDAKFKEIYAIENTPGIENQLQQIGIAPDDINIVINTHLHWDHAGGNTRKEPQSGKYIPGFVNARYVVQKGEFEFASHLNERIKGSYRTEDYLTLEHSYYDLVDGDKTIVNGVRVVRSGGHVPSHQCVLLESDSRKAFYLGDLLPTHYHLPFPYITGFDIEPLVSLQRKKEYLKQAAEENWFLFFSHDATVPFGQVEWKETAYRLMNA